MTDKKKRRRPEKRRQLSDAEREAVAQALRDLSAQAGDSYRTRAKVDAEASRFAGCASSKRVMVCPTCQHKYSFRNSCRSRICDRCVGWYARRFNSRLQELLRPLWSRRSRSFSVKLVTLTFQVDRFGDQIERDAYRRAQREVAQFVKRFYHKFAGRRSRHGNWYLTKAWRGSGAVAVPEVGQSGRNLHFHLIVYGPFIGRGALMDAWAEITGDSSMVDVREVKQLAQAVRYVTKYLAKAPGLDDPNNLALGWAQRLAAWAWLMKGSRRLLMYGIFFGKLPPEPKRDRLELRCWFDGVPLQFIGIGFDPQRLLLDWMARGPNIDFRAGPLPFDYSARLNAKPAPDKLYQVDGDLTDWRYFYGEESSLSAPGLQRFLAADAGRRRANGDAYGASTSGDEAEAER